MRSLNVVVIDLVTNRPTPGLWSRFMNSNLASIMAQAAAVWCEELGHHVRYVCYTGSRDILRDVGDEVDVVIIGAFTRSAQLAYALGNLFRRRGVRTILGGPHARCYPDDAVRWFDVVLGFTDRARPTARPAVGAAALEIYRPGAARGARHIEDRADDQQPRLPVSVPVLHRFDGQIPAAESRPAGGRSAVYRAGDA
jgi:hypothetical protein